MVYKIKFSHSGFFHQLLVGAGSVLLLVQSGSWFSWTSPYLARLSRPDSPIPITELEASWITSLLNIGRLFGSVLGAANSQFLGSRKSVLLTFLPMLLGWTAVFFATSVAWIYVSRILFGIAIGMIFTSFPIFLGEVAIPSARGALISAAHVGAPVSGVITSILGKYLSFSQFSACYAIPAVTGLIIFLNMPDSPQHLIKREDSDAVKTSLTWYYGENIDVDKEFEDIRQYAAAANEMSLQKRLAEFRTAYARRASLIVVMLYVFAQASGINTLVAYMELILEKAQFHLIDRAFLVALATLISVVFTTLSVFIMDKCGRKFLIILSSLGVVISMIGFGTHFLLLDHGYDSKDSLQYLFIAWLLLYAAIYPMGLMIIPSIVQGEILPINVKNVVSCCASITTSIVGFSISMTFLPLIQMIGEASVFYGHAVITFLVIPFVLLYLPETKGKTLNQIQRELIKNT